MLTIQKVVAVCRAEELRARAKIRRGPSRGWLYWLKLRRTGWLLAAVNAEPLKVKREWITTTQRHLL